MHAGLLNWFVFCDNGKKAVIYQIELTQPKDGTIFQTFL
jgi:hypothetical protein